VVDRNNFFLNGCACTVGLASIEDDDSGDEHPQRERRRRVVAHTLLPAVSYWRAFRKMQIIMFWLFVKLRGPVLILIFVPFCSSMLYRNLRKQANACILVRHHWTSANQSRCVSAARHATPSRVL
jgi:hypothetical protein